MNQIFFIKHKRSGLSIKMFLFSNDGHDVSIQTFVDVFAIEILFLLFVYKL